MIDLYRRKVSLDINVGGSVLSIQGLRMAFDVKRDDTTFSNLAEIKIWNLSESTQARLVLPSSVTLSAGWDELFGSVFSGSVYEIQRTVSGADVISTLKASDRAAGSIALSYKGSTAWTVVASGCIKATCDACGVRPGNAMEALSMGRASAYPRGYACHGRAMMELSRVLAVGGLSVSVQSGELLVVSQSSAVGVGQVVMLSPEHGLVGTPELAKKKPPGSAAEKNPKGHVLKALLQPRIYPGAMVAVESSVLKGQYRVTKVGHVGDSEGSTWFSEIEVKP